MLPEILGVRREIKARVDEILRCGNNWSKTAQELTEALNNLTNAIISRDPKLSGTSVVRASRKLAKETKRLTKAFEDLDKTLEKNLPRLS